MYMKNIKALFVLTLGSFLLATGFAFAETAYEQLEMGFGGNRAAEVSPVNKDILDTSGAAPVPAASAPAATTQAPAATVAPAPPAPTPTPAKPPTLGETIKKFIGANARNMLLGGIGAYLGFALLGPVGLVLGALFFLGLGMA